MRWGKEWQRAKSSCEELLVDRNNIGEWTSRLLWKWIKWLWSRFASNSKAAVACLIGFGAYIGMQRPVSFTNRFNGRSIPFHLPYHLAYCLTLSLSGFRLIETEILPSTLVLLRRFHGVCSVIRITFFIFRTNGAYYNLVRMVIGALCHMCSVCARIKGIAF